MKNIIFALIGLVVLSSLTTTTPGKKKISVDKKASTFMYGLDHPLHSFESTAKDFKSLGVFNDESQQLEMIAASVLVKNFDSGNSNRDSHMIETVEGLKFPSISFIAQDVSYDGEKVTAKGKLVFHGETKPFTIEGTQKISGDQLSVSGKFDVNMKEFGVKPPSLMGMSTDENIKVSFDFKFDLGA